MSIKSDRWIKAQCIQPTVWVAEVPDLAHPGLNKLEVCHYIHGERQVTALNGMGHSIRKATLEESRRLSSFKPMIEPFEPNQVRSREFATGSERGRGLTQPDGRRTEKTISYGTSSYGYDIRCAPEFKVFTNVHSTIVDPKQFDEKGFVDFVGDSCIIPPNSFALARSVEWLRIPRDVLTICLGKSTYARCGIIVNVTPLEPEWEGHITLEFSNTTPLPARIYANEGCAQLLFLQADKDDVCETSYADRGGKYQGQSGVTLPKG